MRRPGSLTLAASPDPFASHPAQRAYEEAAWVLDLAERVFGGLSGSATP